MLSIEQFRSSALCCCGPIDLKLPDIFREPELSFDTFKRQLKGEDVFLQSMDDKMY